MKIFTLFLGIAQGQTGGAMPLGTGGSQPLGTGGAQPMEIQDPLGNSSVIAIINNVLNFLIFISVPILALMILIGGFQILTAREDPKKLENGKTTIKYAVIGFVIILISKGVALVILNILQP